MHDYIRAPSERILETWWAKSSVDAEDSPAGVGAIGIVLYGEGFARWVQWGFHMYNIALADSSSIPSSLIGM
ncbi:unnamed protein product [Periconia digitata]|uniref:Uncharacterized protein n=1 Tax=Periconia digitata TaxID=1303443 RepID=A0A9W4UF21_9PLEO|nr:unnamed protein product [Periconia digitata]